MGCGGKNKERTAFSGSLREFRGIVDNAVRVLNVNWKVGFRLLRTSNGGLGTLCYLKEAIQPLEYFARVVKKRIGIGFII